jgi:hypothetical protein
MARQYKYTLKTGRPTKYNSSFVDEVYSYLKIKPERLPTLQGLSLWIGVDVDTLNNWAKVHKEFFGALKDLLAAQATQLINDGIYLKDANSTIVKLLLQNNHGMKERTDATTNDKDLPTPILPTIKMNNKD